MMEAWQFAVPSYTGASTSNPRRDFPSTWVFIQRALPLPVRVAPREIRELRHLPTLRSNNVTSKTASMT